MNATNGVASAALSVARGVARSSGSSTPERFAARTWTWATTFAAAYGMIHHSRLLPRVVVALVLAAVAETDPCQTSAAAATEPPTTAIAQSQPRLDFLYEARVKLGELKMMGNYADHHKRGALQLMGGIFEGPELRGTILPSTKDWPVYCGNGVRLTDVGCGFVTDDGVHLFVSVRGFRYLPVGVTGQSVPGPDRTDGVAGLPAAMKVGESRRKGDRLWSLT